MSDIPADSWTLIGLFLMGLGLNLTPCVYPMLSVTVALFTAGRGSSRHSFFRALIYVFGIVTMYTSLGATAALTGGFFGAALQNPLVLILLAMLLIVLALSLLGVYSFQMPSWLLQRVSAWQRPSALGLYLAGLGVGIIAAPCVGPPVVALLTFVGTRQDLAFGVWAFFVLSLGLGMPYLLLGTLTPLLRRLPKSGPWLLWIEHLFAYVLLVLAAFYLILALRPEVLKWLPVVALVFGGIYLGFLDEESTYPPSFRNFKKVVGVIAILVGLLIPWFLPKASVRWVAYSPEALAAAQAERRPVIMDFYADWCLPCHELDQFTYSDERVIAALEDFAKFKVDLTHFHSPESQGVVEDFGIIGVPTVLILDPDGKEVTAARLNGFVPPQRFLKVVACARRVWERGEAFEACYGER